MTTVAAAIAEWLVSRGIERVYGLCGGHVLPIWDEAARRGIRIVDVRHEGAAVHMAHAEAELTGRPGVALVTAGPGLTNAVTGIANASASRVPVVVISGRVPRPQAGMGGMQDIPQAAVVTPLCRRVEAVSERAHVLPRLAAVWDAALGPAAGGDGPAGPAYVDFPTDLLRESYGAAGPERSWMEARTVGEVRPGRQPVEKAAALLRSARRPVVISGRGARRAGALVEQFLCETGALYLDTAESRGAVVAGHPAAVPAMRARVMREADLVVTLERRLDFQLAYGSPAVFAGATGFVRVGLTREELADNRPADVELRAGTAAALEALLVAGCTPVEPDGEWRDGVRAENAQRRGRLETTLRSAEPGTDGRMHPYTVIAALNDVIPDDAVVVADGGDILSFARVALRAPTWLDPGPLGCLGVGTPFAVGAALAGGGRPVFALIGDGSFGFTALEIDTAVRTGARAVFVVANNDGWNIERHDLLANYEGRLVGVELPGCRYDELARALGAHGERVDSPADLPDALKRAIQSAPAVLDVAVTRDAVSPDFSSGLAGVPDRQVLTAWDEAERRALEG
jgi:acetolactate synthase I/II/III large subunit